MKRRNLIRTALIAAILLLISGFSFAETSGKAGDNATYVLDDDGVLTISGSGRTYDYYNASGIPWKSATSVIIEPGITVIGERLFFECTEIESVVIPNTVTQILDGAFCYCEKLTEILIPESVTIIGDSVFWGTGISEIVIPDTVTEIGTGILGECKGLTTVTIPSGITQIKDYTFKECSSLTTVISSENITSIGDYAFYGCEQLSNLNMSSNVSYIGDSAFLGSGITELVISGMIDEIGPAAFIGCSDLENVVIQGRVNLIGRQAFGGCTALKSITIPEGITQIEEYTFSGCINLESISIPEGVLSIGKMAFENCSKLVTVHLPDTLKSIEEEAFFQCAELEQINLPFGLTGIEQYAFSSCSSLKSISIPTSMTRIESQVFSDCSSLAEVELSERLTSIGNYAFHGCDSLEDIVFPESLAEIGEMAFSGCGFQSILIPDNIQTLGRGAFSSCNNLKKAVLPEGLTVIPDSLFNMCERLRDVSIPDSVISIGNWAFFSCRFERISLPDVLTSIGEGAFYYCGALKEITIPANVTDIGENAFYGDNGLKTVWIASENDITKDRELFSDTTYYTKKIYCYEYSPTDFWAGARNYPIEYIDQIQWSTVTRITVLEEPVYEAGTSYPLKNCYYVFPNDSQNIITYVSDQPEVASVTESGMLNALKPGSVNINVTINGVSAVIPVTVIRPQIRATDFVLEDDIWVESKETEQALIMNLTPENADLDLLWETESATYGTVDQNGVVTGGAPGITTLSVTDRLSGIIRTAKIYSCRPVTAISFEETAITIKEMSKEQLIAHVTAGTQYLDNRLVIFTSSDEDIAVVDRKGVVTGISEGTATITATSKKNGIIATCQVTVEKMNVLILPAGIQTIGQEAFTGLSAADAIRIPETVTQIEEGAIDTDLILLIPAESSWVEWGQNHGYTVMEEKGD